MVLALHRTGVVMKVLMNKNEMARTLERLAYQILEKYENLDDVVLVGIVRRGVYLSNRVADILFEKTGRKVIQGTLDISLYRDDWTSLAAIPELTASDIPVSIEGKRVILIDDVLYSGRTVRAALEALQDYGRSCSIDLLVLVDRGHRELPIYAAYVGKQVNTAKSEQIDVLLEELDGIDEVRLLPE